ncbi:MAG: metallophosphoesterase family protein [Clostridia bacterium]|nr:metallophosphoesterase family protein [Clostridia bacterium]
MAKIEVLRIPLPAPVNLRLAVAGDLHGAEPNGILKRIRAEHPDGILLTGDILEAPPHPARRQEEQSLPWRKKYDIGMAFMRGCVEIAPTFYVGGNHEAGLNERDIEAIGALRVTTLMDQDVYWKGIWVGGLNSVTAFGATAKQPDLAFLQSFAARGGYKLLLCHHPEYFDPYIRPLSVDLTLSGHAHGGQWRLGKQGVFAPGQGIFPKYTKGLYHGRLAVHTGLNNHVAVPRIFNPYQILIVELKTK